MGIYSRRRLYDLDFLPVCIEEYDLLIPDQAWDSPMVRQLLSILKSPAFRRRWSPWAAIPLTDRESSLSWDTESGGRGKSD